MRIETQIPWFKITKWCRQCELVPTHSGCVSDFAYKADEELERVFCCAGETTQQVKVLVAKSDDLSSVLRT